MSQLARRLVTLSFVIAIAWTATGAEAGCDVTWTGSGATAAWSDPENWSSDPSLPGETDTVCHNTGSDEILADLTTTAVGDFIGTPGSGRALRIDREALFELLTDHMDLLQGIFGAIFGVRKTDSSKS